MSNRRRQRRDGEPTADEIQQSQADCPGHVASDKDPKVCARCGIHIDELAPDDDVVDLARTLPPGDGEAPIADAVAERQADAAADSAPAVGAGGEDGGSKPPLNTEARYAQAKATFARLAEIKELQAGLRKEANELLDGMEKGAGFNRGAVAEIRKQMDLSPAAIQARENSRKELFDLMLKPKLDAATADEGRE